MTSDIDRTIRALTIGIEAAVRENDFQAAENLSRQMAALYHLHPEADPVYTVEEIARVLQMSPRSVCEAVHGGEWPYTLLPGPEDRRRHKARIRFTRSQLREIKSRMGQLPGLAHRMRVA